jgi:hypothetical protein
VTVVLTPIDAVAGLAEAIEARHEAGLDRYDEWWEGVYRIVTGLSPEHGRLAAWLGRALWAPSAAAGLHVAAPVNIGTDRADCRVPDIGVYRPDTSRTSPAFLATAVMAVELLSPGEVPGAKLAFYRAHGVEEVLEVDVATLRARLLLRPDSTTEPAAPWAEASASQAIPGLVIVDGAIEVDGERYR